MNGTPEAAPPGGRPTSVRHLVLAALLVITAINYVQRNCIGPAETTVRADLGLKLEQTGVAVAAFFLAYALLQVPSGWLAQRWGPRAALALYAGAWSLALALLALATGLGGLLAGRLALGAFQAGIFPCATLILVAWYPASRRGLASALLNSFMLIGGAVGSMLTGVLLGPLGWRGVFALYALPGLAWAAWFAVWFRNRPQDHPRVNAAELEVIAEGRPGPAPAPEGAPPAPAGFAWGAILLNASLGWICLQQAFRAGANRFFDTWMPTYFQEARGGSVAAAGLLSSLPLWAGVAGGLVGGALSDALVARTGDRRAGRKGVAVFSLLAATAFYAAAYPIHNVWVATAVFSVGAFVSTFAAPCAYALTMDVSGRHVAVVFGVMNMAGNLGAMAFTWGIPRLVRGVSWDAALAVFAGLHVLAALCWLLVNTEDVIGERR